MYQYPYFEPPPPTWRARGKLRPLAIYLAGLVAVAMAVTVYVLLNRLSDEVLTVVATIGCAAGVSFPGLLLAVLLLVRKTEAGRQHKAMQPQTTQPAIMVVPPMALPQALPPQAARPPAATWETVAMPRHFTVVGDE
ncbi:MAG: hypothetical protein B6I35_04520 [Anaerolineaceae bacterium 4572_32.2]|nr:MAG: hypothetical protein B6I35_04520 [Anaerolineaceae bacterium 4572_32.2]